MTRRVIRALKTPTQRPVRGKTTVTTAASSGSDMIQAGRFMGPKMSIRLIIG
jgi:hypothetical protein